jgi:hypothetical protein
MSDIIISPNHREGLDKLNEDGSICQKWQVAEDW